jgi:undecaprenyl-diphosphatase
MPKRLVKPEHIERTKALLHRRRGQALVIGRFTAALRVLVPGMAGISRLPYRSFLLFNALGGIAWAAETAVVGYIAGHSFRAAEHRLSIIGLGVLALLIGGFLVHKLRRHPRVAPLIDARVTTESWTGRPLTLAVAAAALAGWLFGGLLQDVLAHDGAALRDPRWHDDLVQHSVGAISDVARVLTYLGSTPVVYAVVLVAAAEIVRRKRYGEAAYAVVALVVGLLIRHWISVLVHRPRPPRSDWLVHTGGYAFPSGHTTMAVLAWGLVVALAWPFLPERAHRIVAVVGAAVIALIVGATRAYLGVHWPTDVLAGWALGALLLTTAVTGLSLLRFRSHPTPAHREQVRETRARV